MLKRLKTVSMMLFLMGASTGAAYATTSMGVDDVKITQQSGTCTGIVLDAAGETVIGASVVVKGTTNGTITGIDGDFTLTGVKKGDIIEISFVGYQTIEIAWDGKPMNVTLQEDTQTLQEVVITAIGLPKQAKSVGYATTRVSTQEIERANAVNPVNALQGKVAGVQINAGGASGVTSSSAITIRGAKSVDKNNSPIWVIDGMIIQEAVTGNLSGTDWGSQLKNLNPADYESVQVLKGAAATALFGSRGANGAIVIKSKGGKMGKQGIGVEINQTVEFTEVYKSPAELQNEFGMGHFTNGYQGDFTPTGDLLGTGNSWGPRFDGSKMVTMYMPTPEKVPYVAHPDNWKEFFQTGVNSTTNVAVSGGSENSSFRLSYGYTDNKGVFERNNFNRHNIAFRGSSQLNDIFSFEMGVKLGFSKAQNPQTQQVWGPGNNIGMMTTYYTPRNFDVAAYKATYRDPETQEVESASRWSYPRAFFHSLHTKSDIRKEQSLLADFTLRAKLTSWLTASVKANYNLYNISTENKWQGTGAYGAGSNGYGRGGERSGGYNVQGLLQTSEIPFKLWDQDFTFSAIVAAEMYGNTEKHSWRKETKGGLIVPGVYSFSNSKETIIPTFDYTPRNEQTFGVSAIVNLGWKDQLFLELTGRNDWLSTLTYPKYVVDGANNYSVFYPSANASWVFTDTFREKMPEWFSFGKLRASIARVGMGTSAYTTANGFGVYNQGTAYLPDRTGSVVTSKPNLGKAYNNNVKPEIQQQIEVGFDARFFNERLTVDFAYYKANTYNQILSVNSVAESGATSKLINAGNIQNQGIELQIEGTPIRTADWRWTIGGNLTINRGKVVELDPDVKEWCLLGEGQEGSPAIYAFEGGKFGVITSSLGGTLGSPTWFWEGEKGDPRNGKMIIDYYGNMGSDQVALPFYQVKSLYDRNEGDDRTKRHILGKVEADFTMSLNTSLSYKNWDLYVQGDGRFGGNYFSSFWRYSVGTGALKSTLRGRAKEFGGIERINYKGEKVYDAIKLDAVFKEGAKAPLQNVDGTLGELVEVGGMTYMDAINGKSEWGGLGIAPMMTAVHYAYNYTYGGRAMPDLLQDNTWFALREISLGYRLPENICKKFGANYLRVGFTARNICYIINKLSDGINPAAISSNNPLVPIDMGGVPFSRTYAVNLSVRF